jgi:hypothetical protein
MGGGIALSPWSEDPGPELGLWVFNVNGHWKLKKQTRFPTPIGQSLGRPLRQLYSPCWRDSAQLRSGT